MAIKEIREFGDFSGANNEGYIIIGGKTASVEGGKNFFLMLYQVYHKQMKKLLQIIMEN